MAVIPIFVSSTFRDFDQERDLLSGPVTDRLNEAIRAMGCTVRLVDLRWGIDTTKDDEEQRLGRVLDVCLSEVVRTAPLFVGLVGNRYGWTPADIDHVAWAVQEAGGPDDVDLRGRSITELEFGFAGLWNATSTQRPIIIFRDLQGSPPPAWVDEDPTQVCDFRQRLVARWGPPVTYAADVTDGVLDLSRVSTAGRTTSFEELVTDLLLPAVRERATSSGANELPAGERLFRDDHPACVGRDEILTLIDLTTGQDHGYVLTGDPGSGTSAVLLELERRAKARATGVVTVLMEADDRLWTAESLDAELTARAATATGYNAPPQGGRFGQALAVAKDLTLQLLVDGLEELGDDPEDLWPILNWPGKRTVVTTSSPEQTNYLVQHGFTRLTLAPVHPIDVAAYVSQFTTRRGKVLAEPVVSALASTRRTPLWVQLAIDLACDLRTPDFLSIQNGEAFDMAIARLQADRVADLPNEDTMLAAQLVARASSSLNVRQAQDAISLLGLARLGLAPEEIVDLVTHSDDDEDIRPLVVATVIRALGSQVRPRGDKGRLTFMHRPVGEAASQYATPDAHARLALHYSREEERLPAADTDRTQLRLAAMHHALRARKEDSPALAAVVGRIVNDIATSTSADLRSSLSQTVAKAVVVETGLEMLEAVEPATWSLAAVGHFLEVAEWSDSPQGRRRLATVSLAACGRAPQGHERQLVEVRAHAVLGQVALSASAREAHLRAALQITASMPLSDDIAAICGYARTSVLLGQMMLYDDRFEQAEDHLFEAMTLLNDLVAAGSQDPEVYCMLADGAYLMSVSWRRQDPAEQSVWTQRALRAAVRAVEKAPREPVAILAKSRTVIAFAREIACADPDKARALAKRAVQDLKQLTTARPYDARCREALQEALIEVSPMGADGDMWKFALEAFRSAVARAERAPERAVAVLDQPLAALEGWADNDQFAQVIGRALTQLVPRIIPQLARRDVQATNLAQRLLRLLNRYHQIMGTGGFGISSIHQARVARTTVMRRLAADGDATAQASLAFLLTDQAETAALAEGPAAALPLLMEAAQKMSETGPHDAPALSVALRVESELARNVALEPIKIAMHYRRVAQIAVELMSILKAGTTYHSHVQQQHREACAWLAGHAVNPDERAHRSELTASASPEPDDPPFV